jgi:hypothetical protein
MSINYYGVATADPKQIGALVERVAQPNVPPLDVDGLRDKFTKVGFTGAKTGTLKWEPSAGGYLYLDLSPTCALVTHNAGCSEDVLDKLLDVLWSLQQSGVNVYDPQQGKWFPGSPVKQPKRKATTKAKPKARAKPAAKAKPKARAKAKPKARANTKKKKKKK